MRRALLTALAVLFVAAPAAEAAEVSGRLVFCTGDDICRYFPEPRLEVAFVAAAGEANELRLTSHPDGVRVVDAGAAITTGSYCTPVSPNEAVCGPPAPSGLLATALTGDAADSAFADTGSVFLGRGRDHGVAQGAAIDGGRGADRLISAAGGSLLTGASGRDHLSGANGEEVLIGGSGKDLLVARGGPDTVGGGKGADLVAGGAGRDDIHAGSGDDLIHALDPARDTVRCGRGDDRALVSAWDRVFGCERISCRVDE